MIKTCEVYEDSLVTLEQAIDKAVKENGITSDNLFDIKYNKDTVVTPYIDDDHIRDENAFSTETNTSALIIWDDDG